MREGYLEVDSVFEKVPCRLPFPVRTITLRRKHKPAARPRLSCTRQWGDQICPIPTAQTLKSLHRAGNSSHRTGKKKKKIGENEERCREMLHSKISDMNRSQSDKELQQRREKHGDQRLWLTFSPFDPLRIERGN